jgi:hypothetical protein
MDRESDSSWGSDADPPEYEGPTYDPRSSGGEFYKGTGHPQLCMSPFHTATHVHVIDSDGVSHFPGLEDYFEEGDLIWQGDDVWSFQAAPKAERASWIYRGGRIIEATDEVWNEVQAELAAKEAEELNEEFAEGPLPSLPRDWDTSETARKLWEAANSESKDARSRLLKAFMEKVLEFENAKADRRPTHSGWPGLDKNSLAVLREHWKRQREAKIPTYDIGAIPKSPFEVKRTPGRFDPRAWPKSSWPDGEIMKAYDPPPHLHQWTVLHRELIEAKTPQVAFNLCMKKFEEALSRACEAILSKGWPLEFGEFKLDKASGIPSGIDGTTFTLTWKPKSSPIWYSERRVEEILADPENAVRIVRDTCEMVARTVMPSFVDGVVYADVKNGPAS